MEKGERDAFSDQAAKKGGQPKARPLRSGARRLRRALPSDRCVNLACVSAGWRRTLTKVSFDLRAPLHSVSVKLLATETIRGDEYLSSTPSRVRVQVTYSRVDA